MRILRKLWTGCKVLAVAGGLLAGAMLVSPEVRAEVIKMSLPCYWGTIDGPLVMIETDGDFMPTTANVIDLGSSTRPFANAWVSNLTAGAQSFTSGALSGALNVTGTTTLNALVGNSTGNFTGTVTTNAFVGNSTLNTTGLATLDNCTVNGTVAAGTNISVGQILQLAKTTVNSSNTTLSGNTSFVALVNMSGNHTLTLPDPAAAGTGALIVISDMITSIGTTGNLTIAATAGNINNIDTYTVTNTAGATGNVSQIQCLSDGADWSVAVLRR